MGKKINVCCKHFSVCPNASSRSRKKSERASGSRKDSCAGRRLGALQNRCNASGKHLKMGTVTNVSGPSFTRSWLSLENMISVKN